MNHSARICSHGRNIGLAVLCCVPAIGVAEACAAVIEAMGRVYFQPGYHRVLAYSIQGEPQKEESIKAGTRLYARDNGSDWKEDPLPVATLQENSKHFPWFARNCRQLADETVPEGAMTVFEFDDVLHVRGRLWIGKADGLPYLYTKPGTRMTYRYADVQAPAHLAQKAPAERVLPLKLCSSGQILEGTWSGDDLVFGSSGGVARLRYGMTKAEVDAAAAAGGLGIDKATLDEWRIGDEVFIFEDGRLARNRRCL